MQFWSLENVLGLANINSNKSTRKRLLSKRYIGEEQKN